MSLSQETTPDRRGLSDALERLGSHDHLCLIYETRDEQFAAVIPFIRIGLERGEKCVYIADENTADDVLAAMRADGIDVEGVAARGALSVVSRRETYLRDGRFDPDRMLDFLRDATRSALAEDFKALRVTGEMTWVLAGDAGSERVIEYEAKLNNLFPAEQCLAICQYNRTKFPESLIVDVIRTHPLVIYRGVICRNLYYIPPAELLGPGGPGSEVERLLNNIRDREAAEIELQRVKAELEERVTLRTAELRSAIEQLRYEIVNRTQAESALRDSHELLETIFAHTHQAIAYLDVDLIIVRVNKVFAEADDRDPDYFIGKKYFDIFPDNGFSTVFRRVVETGEPHGVTAFPYAFPRRPERGTTYWDWTLTPVCNPSGRVVGLVFCALDVTAHKLAELHLVDKERDAKALTSAPTDVAMLLDAQGMVLEANDTVCLRWGLERSKVVGVCLWDLLPASVAAVRNRSVEEVFRTGQPVRFEDDRQGVWYDNVLWPVRDSSGQVARVALLGRDITERRHTEMEIRRLSSFPAEDPYPVMELRPSGEVTYRNPACGRYLAHVGLSAEEPQSLLPPDFRELIGQCLGERRDVVVRERTINDVTLSWSFHPLSDQDLVHAHGQDVTERKRAERTLRKAHDELERRVLARTADLENANRLLRIENAERRKVEEALEESQEHYQVMLASVSSYRYTVDTRDGVAIRTEHGAGCAAVTGYTPGDYAHDPHLWFTMIHPEDRTMVQQHVARLLGGEDVPPIEHRIVHRGGPIRWIRDTMVPNRDTDGRMIHYDGIVEDITERKRLEQEREDTLALLEELVRKRTAELETSREQLVRAERLASIGTLAAGIAHEINNPVGMMLLAAQAAMRYRGHPGGQELVEQSLNRIINNARRCGQIVRGVLQFARQEPTEKWPASLNLAVTAACQAVVDYAREHGATVETELDGDLPNILINPMQIEQVVVNLVKNAIEAGEAGKKVSVRTMPAPMGARLLVQDRGRGMTDEQLKHLFDPFFTTRQQRGGTGLGLSIVHGIISEHGGTIEVNSRFGQGSTFTIDLPRGPVVQTEVAHG